MDYSDHLAKNLFFRLSQYVPSEGEKRVRRPLEDFSTEALAYCLIHSDDFRHAFVEQVLGENNPRIKRAFSNCCEVSTQVTKNSRRADLVLCFQNENETQMTIGVEVKLDAPPGRDQVEDLSKSFDYAFLLAPRRRFSELSPECASHSVQLISWEVVQRLLLRISCSSEKVIENTLGANFLRQLSDYLIARGFGFISISHHPMKCKNLFDSGKTIYEWNVLFQKLQLAGFRPSDLRKAKLEHDPDRDRVSYGCYSSSGHYQWIGMSVELESVICCYQEDFSGDCKLVDDETEGDGRSFSIWEVKPKCVGIGYDQIYPDSDSPEKLCEIFENLQKLTRIKANDLKLESYN